MGRNKPKNVSNNGLDTNKVMYKKNRPKRIPVKVKTIASKISKKDIVLGPSSN